MERETGVDPDRPIENARKIAQTSRSVRETVRVQRRWPANSVTARVHTLVRRRRNAFPITETELKLIAAAAIMGLKRTRMNG